MSETVGDFLVQRLHDWGVRRIYGYPGDGINGFFGALHRAEGTDHAIDFIQVRHEEMAAFMAAAHAKLTGELGVCIATSGPGAIHLLNGLYDAKLDHQPVLAILGQQARMSIGGSYQQEVDLEALFADVSHQYTETVNVPEQARHVLDRAVRIARSERTVTTVVLPNDVQELPYSDPPRHHGNVVSGIDFRTPVVTPSEPDLQAAADVLNAGSKVAVLIGAGARNARPELVELQDLLGAGVAKALLGKDVLADTLPWVTGAIGLLGTRASWDLMAGCDTLLMIGTSFPYAEFLPKPGQARGVQIELDPRMAGIRHDNEVNLIGDAAATLRLLLPLLDRKTDRSWQEAVEGSVRDWHAVRDERAKAEAEPINPQRVFSELSSRLPGNAVVTSDSGSAANWYARNVDLHGDSRGTLSGNLASMGAAVPYAIGAKFAHPDRPVIALVGDGAMQMNNMAELITIAKYWQRWSSPTLVVMVLNNRDLNQVTWEQREMMGDPKYVASQQIPDVAYADFARSIGLDGLRVEDPDELGAAWDRALAADKPFVLDVRTDPDVPPLPPHITFEQARAFMASTPKDVNRAGIVKESARQILATIKH